MPKSLLGRIGKTNTDLRHHNMVLWDYEGKMSKAFEVIQVNIVVGTLVRPTLFVVMSSKANYNLLQGREWIHCMGEVLSTLHQKISIWRPDGIVENIEVDQSYFLEKVDLIDKKTFDKSWANISTCFPTGTVFSMQGDFFYSLKLYHTHGFIWEHEVLGVRPKEDALQVLGGS